MSQEHFQALLKKVNQVSDIGGAAALLGWDQRTIMPRKGGSVRGERLATLAGLAHEIFTSDEVGTLLDKSEDYATSQPADSFEASLWHIVKRNYEKQRLIPSDLKEQMQRASSHGYDAWQVARPASDYGQFRDALARNIDLTRQVIELRRAANPDVTDDYDLLLDDYEPGMRTAEVAAVFDRLKEATLPLVRRVAEQAGERRERITQGQFPAGRQEVLARDILKAVGYTDDAWRLDTTLHPFASSMATSDIRITTKFQEDFLNPSFFGTLHEFGHGLYERQVDPSLERTPLARGASMMWHESQSRMWENLVGRGRPFWTWAMPRVKAAFPEQFGKSGADDMYRAVNAMAPSLIRIEADELTYNFHIILRFELERALFDGSVTVDTLPEAWNVRIHEYLGVDVPDDANGVLQDVHWGAGSFGYFPTYALGNVLGAMLWERITCDEPDLESGFERGDFAPLREWLGHHVHRHGSKFLPMPLLEKVLGEETISAEPLVAYLSTKVDSLYP